MLLADPREVLKFVTLRPGYRVADFGAGSGAYTSVLLERIGTEGKVYALDALPQSLERIRHSAEGSGKKCMTLNCEFESALPMKENLLDLAILANTLHHVDPHARQSFVSELARVVVPGGEVLIVDWAGSFNNMGPARSMIVTPVDAVRLFRASGFNTGDMLPAGTHQYAFVATLPR
ncbi:MAG: class I SAM-dependent methyltransferase [Patescibacteria group bacterium]